MAINDDRWDWLAFGIERGWVSNSFCATHDGPPFTEEDAEIEEEWNEPPCMPCVRVWEEDQAPDQIPGQMTIADIMD